MEGNKHADCKHVKPENVGNKQKEVCESSKEFVRTITGSGVIEELPFVVNSLKGYCTVFQHALKLLKLTGIDLT